MNSCYCGKDKDVCGADKATVLRTKIRHGVDRNVLQCGECDVVFLEPIEMDLQEYYREEYRKEYSPSVEREMSPRQTYDMYRPFMDERIDRVKQHLSPDMTVLEIGCATGHFLDALKPYTERQYGLEYNEAHSTFVRNQLGIECFSTPIQETGLEENSLDMIFMFHIFEHVENPSVFLEEVTRYLKPGGKVYIEVPNVDDALLSTYGVETYADFYYKDPHLFYFTPSTLRLVADSVGIQGEIEMIQRYSLLNHLYWTATGNPMPDAESGMAIPKFTGAQEGFAGVANEWLAKVDAEYRELLKEHNKAEAFAFVGVKK